MSGSSNSSSPLFDAIGAGLARDAGLEDARKTPAPAAAPVAAGPALAPPTFTPTAPSATESKAAAIARNEEERTERQRVEQIQRQLRLETLQRSRGFGLRSLFGPLGGRSGFLGSG